MYEWNNKRHEHVYRWLLTLGGDNKAVEFQPYDFIRKSGFLATPEAVEKVKADLVEMEEDGWLLIGPKTGAGHMVMATDKMAEAMLMTFERMVSMHAQMSEQERTMLSQWEKTNLGGPDQLATSDWPGWQVIFKRLAH
jgi:hypothetical protein